VGANIDALDPDLAQGCRELLQACAQAGVKAQITSTVRSEHEQKFLWDRYQKGLAAYPAVPPKHSAHEYGWAFDLVVTPYSLQANVGQAWQTYWGGTWGGAKDMVHFELPGAGALAWKLGEQGSAPTATNNPSLWDYIGWSLDFTSLSGMLLELGIIVSSPAEAEKICRALHIDPNGRVF
jgi:hypothetical protein